MGTGLDEVPCLTLPGYLGRIVGSENLCPPVGDAWEIGENALFFVATGPECLAGCAKENVARRGENSMGQD